jgi:DNA-binding NtrC family response regulator
MNILLVDDQKFFLTLYQGLLKEADPSYNFVCAETGAEAVSKFGNGINLVILDYLLPDMDGIQVMLDILAKDPYVPVIMITGEGSARVATNALKNGAYDFVVKTDEYIKTLPFVVEQGLERKRLIEETRRLEVQRMEVERLSVLKETVATLSHEINNPLTSIFMTARLMKDRCGNDEYMTQKLSILIENAKRIEDKVAKLSNAVAVVKKDYTKREKMIDIEKSLL